MGHAALLSVTVFFTIIGLLVFYWRRNKTKKDALVILFFGRPGSGKGWRQEESEKLGFTGWVAGNVCRKHFPDYAAKGELVPCEHIISHFLHWVGRVLSGNRLICFDGLRTDRQCAALLDHLEELGYHDVIAFDVEVPEAVCRERLRKRAEKLGRLDDAKRESIETRFAVYNSEWPRVKHLLHNRGVRLEVLPPCDGDDEAEIRLEILYQLEDALCEAFPWFVAEGLVGDVRPVPA